MHDNYDYDIFPINKNIVLIKKQRDRHTMLCIGTF